MANVITDTLYRVALDSERNYVYVSAEDISELMGFLAKEYAGKRDVYGVKEVGRDGTLTTVSIITDECYQALLKKYDHSQQPFKPVYIDGQPYAVRMPRGGSRAGESNEWDDILEQLGENSDLLHWRGMSSWCQDLAGDMEDARVHRGFRTPDHRSYTIERQLTDVGFRPVFEPLDPKTMKPDQACLCTIKDGSVFPMGSLYQDGKPLHNPIDPTWFGDIPRYKYGSQLNIGDTDPDPAKQIRVIKVGNVFIADRNLITGLSWNMLKEMGVAY